MEGHKHVIDIMGNNPAKKLIVVGGMHGNESSGVVAIQNVLPQIRKHLNHTGTVYFLKGNVAALSMGERFIDMDLNRLWLDKYIHSKDIEFSDIEALQSLHSLIVNDICNGEFDNCTFVDLHTFSAKSGIFCIPSGNRKSVAMAQSYGVPFIEKLSEMLPGTALRYFGLKGMTSVVFEGGTHQTDDAVKNLEAALWQSLAYTNLIDNQLDIIKESQNRLKEISEKYPHHLELIYRHKLENYHDFKMRSGYYNFKPVQKSEALALQDQSEIKSPASGYMLMPLYQKKGSDGFFIVKEKEVDYV